MLHTQRQVIVVKLTLMTLWDLVYTHKIVEG